MICWVLSCQYSLCNKNTFPIFSCSICVWHSSVMVEFGSVDGIYSKRKIKLHLIFLATLSGSLKSMNISIWSNSMDALTVIWIQKIPVIDLISWFMITNNISGTLSVNVYTSSFKIFSWLVQKVQNDYVIYLHHISLILVNVINQISMINDPTNYYVG